MDGKQYYVKVNFEFEFGVDNGDGTFVIKNDGVLKSDWVSMQYDNAVGLQNYAVIPAMNMLATKAGELGLLVTDIDFPGKDEIAGATGKPENPAR